MPKVPECISQKPQAALRGLPLSAATSEPKKTPWISFLQNQKWRVSNRRITGRSIVERPSCFYQLDYKVIWERCLV